MRVSLTIFIFITLFQHVVGIEDPPPIKWGKISTAEKSISSETFSEHTPAVVLCDFGSIEITNRTMYSRHVRMKVLSEEGLGYAKIEIPYLAANKYDDVLELKAQTINIDERGEITKFNIRHNQIKDEIIDRKWRKKVFVFPAVKPGSIIEYKYKIASLDFVKLKDWYFKADIPILWSEIRFETPQPFTYLVTYKKGKDLTYEEKEAYVRRLQWMFDQKPRHTRHELLKNNNVLYEAPRGNYRVYVLNNIQKRIVMNDIPGFDEKSSEVKAEAPHLSFHLYKAEGPLPYWFKPLLLSAKTENPEDLSVFSRWYSAEYFGHIYYRLRNWEEFNDNLLQNKNFGLQLSRSIIPKQQLDSIAKGATEYSKIENILAYVKSNIKWNGEYSTYATGDLNKIIEKKEGNSAVLNLTLINLLRRAGFTVNPILVKTNTLNRVETVYPVHKQFNHVLAYISDGSKNILLDATGNQYKIVQGVNDIGWIVDREEYGWLNISKSTDYNYPVKYSL